ncbi:anti-sigma factor family protein [Streptomyces yaizuensis]|uniref:Zf-HC2 domain-containing protein n=1 Tax=Streptomyces yaizuensis TaxID=2989713 RepID=A0ABQ5P2D3_9ACTN|nr:hypothetical protein [Streptomyces sp. YSPA8]GLF96763.1 zf-HC2 domain-containing protein [Streptomyces sp. YSPA8]
MTSTADTTQHPDVSEISDLTEGLLSPARAAELRQHLDDCELCADVRASLEEIRELLGTLPGAARMPADVAGRIDAALAAEALLASTAPQGDSGHVSRETSTVSRETSAAEAGAPPVVPAQEHRSAAGPADRPSGRPAVHSRGTTGPGRAARTRRGRKALGALLAVAAAGVGFLLIQPLTSSDTSHPGATRAHTPVAGAAAQDFSGPELAERVRSLAAGLSAAARSAVPTVPDNGFGTQGGELESPKGGAPEGSPSAVAEPRRLHQPGPVPPCVQRATARGDSPLGVEAGSYRGESAFLLVFPHRTDSAQLQAYVISTDCTTKDPTSTGKVLFHSSYPRD